VLLSKAVAPKNDALLCPLIVEMAAVAVASFSVDVNIVLLLLQQCFFSYWSPVVNWYLDHISCHRFYIL
jgi:hypothetical protein